MLSVSHIRQQLRLAIKGESGSALILSLVFIFVMTLLGVALFDLGAIEALLTTNNLSDAQAFHCAEAALDSIVKDSTKLTTISGLSSGVKQTYTGTDLGMGSSLGTVAGSYTPSIEAIGGTPPTVKATCAMAGGERMIGATRTIQAGLTITLPNAIYERAVVSGDTSALAAGFGNFYLGGTGIPTNNGGTWVGGADQVNGDLYVSGIAALRGAPVLTPCHSSDCDPNNNNPQLTAIGGLQNTSTTFDPTAPGAYGTTGINPMPSVTSTVNAIRTAVANSMSATYNGSTAYNLTQIFATLGTAPGGDTGNEGNLCRPGTGCSITPGPACVYGAATTDPKCQVWQDLVYLGIKSTKSNPGPTDYTSYYFMGIPRAPSNAPQQTSFATIYSNLVHASPELQQMGFITALNNDTMGNLGSRLDALVGVDIQYEARGRSERLVDFTVGTGANGQAVLRSKPPIFFIDDGYFRVDDAKDYPTYGYNGIATVVTSKSVIISDNIVYLNGGSNKNTALPSSCASINDRTNCGLADVLGIVAQNDIWVGDASGNGATVERASGVMLAGRDFNYFDWTSGNGCCTGPYNPVTLNGTVMADRQVTMARDWSDPVHQTGACGAGGGSCLPVQFFPNDSSCGITGCWQYLNLDTDKIADRPTYGALVPYKTWIPTGSTTPYCTTHPADVKCSSFQGCEIATCLPNTRRISHFQLNVNYEHRLWHNSALIPPGLPTGTSNLPATAIVASWKDCGSNSSCP